MKVKLTYCKNFASAETREVEWDKFVSTATKSVGYASKEESVKRAAVVGGLRADETGHIDIGDDGNACVVSFGVVIGGEFLACGIQQA